MQFFVIIPLFFIFCQLLTMSNSGKHTLTTAKYFQATKDTSIRDFPYLATLRSKVTKLQFCTGTIISPTHIITTAQCILDENVKKSDMVVYVGACEAHGMGYLHAIKNITIDPKYTGHLSHMQVLTNNLAVVELMVSIDFDETRKKISLSKTEVKSSVEAVVVGWRMYVHGRINEPKPLQMLPIVVYNSSKCNKRYYLMVNDDQLCAHRIRGSSQYPGDLGGPLIYNQKLLAVFSHITRTKEDNLIIYTSVPKSLRFINKALSTR